MVKCKYNAYIEKETEDGIVHLCTNMDPKQFCKFRSYHAYHINGSSYHRCQQPEAEQLRNQNQEQRGAQDVRKRSLLDLLRFKAKKKPF